MYHYAALGKSGSLKVMSESTMAVYSLKLIHFI